MSPFCLLDIYFCLFFVAPAAEQLHTRHTAVMDNEYIN